MAGSLISLTVGNDKFSPVENRKPLTDWLSVFSVSLRPQGVTYMVIGEYVSGVFEKFTRCALNITHVSII